MLMIETKTKRDYLVEIWFPIEKDEDGYPESRNWEQLPAKPTETVDCFRLESVPFYLKDVSRNDLVKAKVVNGPDGTIFEFDRVIERGGHNTYRLLLRTKQSDDPDFTERELIKRGLAVEEQHGNFFAVDVPPSADQQAVDRYLVSESESGRWEVQDGYLHTVPTEPPKVDGTDH
jgi:Domain of unknown function (DUF4265)